MTKYTLNDVFLDKYRVALFDPDQYHFYDTELFSVEELKSLVDSKASTDFYFKNDTDLMCANVSRYQIPGFSTKTQIGESAVDLFYKLVKVNARLYIEDKVKTCFTSLGISNSTLTLSLPYKNEHDNWVTKLLMYNSKKDNLVVREFQFAVSEMDDEFVDVFKCSYVGEITDVNTYHVYEYSGGLPVCPGVEDYFLSKSMLHWYITSGELFLNSQRVIKVAIGSFRLDDMQDEKAYPYKESDVEKKSVSLKINRPNNSELFRFFQGVYVNFIKDATSTKAARAAFMEVNHDAVSWRKYAGSLLIKAFTQYSSNESKYQALQGYNKGLAELQLSHRLVVYLHRIIMYYYQMTFYIDKSPVPVTNLPLVGGMSQEIYNLVKEG